MQTDMADRPKGELSPAKRVLFWGILSMVPVLFVLVAVAGYYLYGYVTLTAEYCEPFASLDDEIGWTLTPGADSCVNGRESAFGPLAFASRVALNRDGARVAATGDETQTGGLLVIGDSWSFGYGTEWHDTFAAQLADDFPVALFASPAYSGAQALLLGRRVAPTVAPRFIVYLELGFWERAVCTGEVRPAAILKPCYWADPATGEAELVSPPPGYVTRAAAWGLRPGGMVGAGEKTLGYFLIARPWSKLHSLLVRAGLASGFADDFAARAPVPELDAVRRAHYRGLRALAAETGATLVLIDPGAVYADARASAGSDPAVVYVDRTKWDAMVEMPMAQLPLSEARVPVDGHYGPGTHRLIADLVRRAIAQR